MFRAPAVRIGRWFAALAKMAPAKLSNVQPQSDRRPIVARYDVMGRPVLILANGDGTETALDYGGSPATGTPAVPIEWVKALGFEIDPPRFDGLCVARDRRGLPPLVGIGSDNTVVIITAKGAITRKGGESMWRRGVHVSAGALSKMRRATGELEACIIASSQRPDAFLSPGEVGTRIAKAVCDALNAHVIERHGGIYEENLPLPGLRHWGFSDDEIAASKCAAADLIARVARLAA